MTLAQRVRDYRYSKGWGPDELASRAAISRTALYQIESGKTELPRAGTLRRIALALDVSMETLLGHSDEGAAAAATG
ncbi:helix-turn-helix domain-containing protein, partial [Singulisphaera rosea]